MSRRQPNIDPTLKSSDVTALVVAAVVAMNNLVCAIGEDAPRIAPELVEADYILNSWADSFRDGDGDFVAPLGNTGEQA